ncbi:uncharacterized protein CFAP97D1 [Denticeps clupeoides]|uniref:uncharacterized protein CFAP97D1 n=1 Tax=Denticeps clupeoides TaxID=299321 RepID=UPI0010A4E7B0|nr:uncharacterized protein CFAP97D1-like [Denticeps clupeoides]
MAHLAYQPAQPCVSRLLQYKWDKSAYNMHRMKVSSAKATINSNPPKTYNHLLVKKKKQKLEEERIGTIKRDNNILLGKISHIMRTTGSIDNRKDQAIKRPRSNRKQLELLRITVENRRTEERLRRCAPSYSVQRWRDDWRETLRLTEAISRYPQNCQKSQRNMEDCKKFQEQKEAVKDAV